MVTVTPYAVGSPPAVSVHRASAPASGARSSGQTTSGRTPTCCSSRLSTASPTSAAGTAPVPHAGRTASSPIGSRRRTASAPEDEPGHLRGEVVAQRPPADNPARDLGGHPDRAEHL